jgi:hypothetical protein
MADIIRVYIFEGYRDTVIESQVFNWASELEKIGLKTVGLSLTNRRYYKKKNDTKLASVAKKYLLDVHSHRYDNYLFLREMQMILIIVKLYRKLSCNQTKVVFQTRMPGLVKVLSICRALLGAKFIMDMRSSALTEFYYICPGSSANSRKSRMLRNIEKQVVLNSNAVFCVSNVLKSYLLATYAPQGYDSAKITVVPCAADQHYFYFDENLRKVTRLKLNCENKIIFTYSGRLDKKWQVPEKVFELFNYINQNIANAFFIILTPDLDIVRKSCKDKGINEASYFAVYEELDGINQYLNATDYAVVLRENLPINHHASPTKISEYLLSGLSVIISPNIGDLSSFIEKNELGYVIDVESPNCKAPFLAYLNKDSGSIPDDTLKRSKRALLASKYYSKDIYLEIIKQKCIEI